MILQQSFIQSHIVLILILVLAYCHSRNFQDGFKLTGDNRSLSRVAAAFSRSGIEPSPIALSAAAITTPDMLGLRKRSEK